MVKPGNYQHYKGGVYKVLFTAFDTRTDKPVVVYVNLDHGTIYTRPLAEFTQKVKDENNYMVPRFHFICGVE